MLDGNDISHSVLSMESEESEAMGSVDNDYVQQQVILEPILREQEDESDVSEGNEKNKNTRKKDKI